MRWALLAGGTDQHPYIWVPARHPRERGAPCGEGGRTVHMVSTFRLVVSLLLGCLVSLLPGWLSRLTAARLSRLTAARLVVSSHCCQVGCLGAANHGPSAHAFLCMSL